MHRHHPLPPPRYLLHQRPSLVLSAFSSFPVKKQDNVTNHCNYRDSDHVLPDLDEGGVHADGQTLVVSAGDALLAGGADVAGPGAQPAPRHLAALRAPPEERATGVAASG